MIISPAIFLEILILSIIKFLQFLNHSLILCNIFIFHQFTDDGLIPVFDHVLSPNLFKKRHNAGPVAAGLLHKLKDDLVLLSGPLSLLDLVVEVVLPALSALFRGFEALFP